MTGTLTNRPHAGAVPVTAFLRGPIALRALAGYVIVTS